MSNKIDLDDNLLELLPLWYREVLDYQQICNAEKNVFDALGAEMEAVAGNFFFQTMDLSAITQWEKIFGITPNPQTESLDFRRSRLLNRISTRPPFTLGFLYQKLDELMGPDAWNVLVDYPNYTLYIQSSAENQVYADEVAYTIGQIKPAHIVYVNNPFTKNGLLISETVKQAELRWNYVLGSWLLGAQPFETDLSSKVVKPATMPSIQSLLLNNVASFISDDIASVQLNGSVSVDNIEKSVENNILTITYTVTAAQTEEITSYALLDNSGAVLAKQQIYVPVQTSVLMTHTIPVAEGVTRNG